jgi:cell division protein FtsB
LTLGNLKKFHANVREFTKFSVVSITVEYFFLMLMFLETDCRLLQQLANYSYLKSQKLKETTVDRQRINLLETENAALKKDKAALEQNVKMLKEVIQKNRGNFLYCLCCGSLLFGRLFVDVLLVFSIDWTESHQKELQELKATAQTVVNLVDLAEGSNNSLTDRLQRAP